IVALEAVETDVEQRMPTLADVYSIGKAIEDVDAKLVIIDPLMAYLPGKTDAYRDQDVRRLLAQVAQLATATSTAVLVLRHLTKGGGSSNPIYRGGGSIGIIGAARSGLMVAKDPDDETGERRCIATTKCNLALEAATLAYRIADIGGVPLVQWEG